MDKNQARKSSAEDISQPPQAGDFIPNGNTENPVVASFNGNYEDAVNYYHK